MSERQALIQDIVGKLTASAPKIVTYHNATLLVLRNGDGHRVATLLEHDLAPDQLTSRINQLYKVKSENQPSQETLARLSNS